MREDFDDPTPDSEVPTSQFISEGNGGEFRKSYHGYPKVHFLFLSLPQLTLFIFLATSTSPCHLYLTTTSAFPQGFCSTGRIPDNVPHPADADRHKEPPLQRNRLQAGLDAKSLPSTTERTIQRPA